MPVALPREGAIEYADVRRGLFRAGLADAAGALTECLYVGPADAQAERSWLLALFAAAILGGVGSLIGAVVGGLLVGLAENLSVLVAGAGYKTAMPFLLLLLVLFFRPQGIFGQR